MSTVDAADLVLLSPRYLAGCGANVRDVLGPLIHLFGWKQQRKQDGLSVDSPCGSVYINFAPGRIDGLWRTISHHEPYWSVQFTRQTPLEAVAAVPQVLPQLVGDTRHGDRIAITTTTITQPADANNWKTTTDGPVTEIRSPDGHCELAHTPDEEIRWAIRSSLYGGFDTEWTATFTRDTPVRAVGQFFTHLATAEPVERVLSEVPHLVQMSSSAVITPVTGASVAPHVHHAVVQAAQAHTGPPPRR